MSKKQRNVLLISLGIALAIFACAVTIILVKASTKKDEPTTTDDGSLKYVAMLDFELNSDESGYLISGKETTAGDIIIPRTYNGKPVVGIADDAFYENTELTGVKILNGSNMSIGEKAFYNCSNLTNVTLSDSVTSIGLWAFYGCAGLTSVTIPNSVTIMANGVFENCTGLIGVTLSDSVTSIGLWAFYGCTGLTSITIPNSVTEIGYSTFPGCTNLTSVTFENTTGWTVDGYSLSSTDLANATTAATYLTSTYRNKYWKRV